ncbi:hypothetical protein RJI07_03630 [Mycoplasmatota bacterium WC30]
MKEKNTIEKDMDKIVFRPVIIIVGFAFLLIYMLAIDTVCYVMYFIKHADIELLYGALFFSALIFVWFVLGFKISKDSSVTITKDAIYGNFLIWSDEEKERLRPKKAYKKIDIKQIKTFTDIYAPKPRSGAQYVFLFETNSGDKTYLIMLPFIKKHQKEIKSYITRMLEYIIN